MNRGRYFYCFTALQAIPDGRFLKNVPGCRKIFPAAETYEIVRFPSSYLPRLAMPANPYPSSGPDTLMPDLTTRSPISEDRFIICGLGSLGQQCVLNLKKFDYDPFEVHITAIDQRKMSTWETDDLPSHLVQPPIIGDCRRESVLRDAGIEHARAILIVTSNESTNVECAIAARRLNPDIQIILRSSRHSLNALLARQLGKFVALDATELPAMTFALAGLGDDIVSVFTIGRHQFKVTERFVRAGDPRFDQKPVQQLHKGLFRLLDFNPVEAPQQPLGWATTASSIFHRWQPFVRVSAGDRVAYIEVKNAANQPKSTKNPLIALTQWADDLRHTDWRKRIATWRQSSEESIGRVVAIALFTALALWILGALLLKFKYGAVPGGVPDGLPETLSWVKAISLGAILLLGGYGDVFGGFNNPVTPGWVQLVCLTITLISILVVLGVLGLVAERLLNSRFDFLQKRPRIPRSNHVDRRWPRSNWSQGNPASLLTEFRPAFSSPLRRTALSVQSCIPHCLLRHRCSIGDILESATCRLT